MLCIEVAQLIRSLQYLASDNSVESETVSTDLALSLNSKACCKKGALKE